MGNAEKIFEVSDINAFKQKALVWSSQFTHVSYFSNCSISFPHEGFSNILFAGAHKILKFSSQQSFQDLSQQFNDQKTWLAGYFSYDLKNEVESLHSDKTDLLNFEKIYFYQPEHLIIFFESGIRIFSELLAPETIYALITETIILPATPLSIQLHHKISRDTYLRTISLLKDHIVKGDVYEVNFCLEFFNAQAKINPLETYFKIIEKSPSPFSAYQKINDTHLICSSPERFIKKEGHKLISQPIKGTSPRYLDNEKDARSKYDLLSSEKERAENMMIVDLVRNDLAKSSVTGSVVVEELFGIYSFAQVHQMISTISSHICPKINFAEAIKNAFPMGSMTGAPKIRAMELIEQYEQSKRGLFSGSVGFINPEGDFDFNVVIRSLLYNSSNDYLSLQVGSAITYDSVPEKEYEECFLKGKAIMDVLL